MAIDLDVNEFFDVYRQFRPGATRQEFEEDWAEFLRAKEDYRKRKSVQ